ncbi:multiple inositol polyphosphate phosphatase 1 [Hylaeus volcanicus]|uniref:multiple inositol polyphosphate phosphatase 1 n=1 Tax=Hylaeus volcanicus TaxID=313075 RepID=UPI0023B7F38F|nr:multiple inositol polyphosphate phosphatase 1 [Hylaeus volcanicus]XP_053988501.1 multiple inositol polyphosphate phosphatase 1 [Hylaeus volcanicus]
MQLLLSMQIFIIVNMCLTISFAHNCILYSEDYKCKLGTKTPYRFIANYDDFPLEYKRCVPKKIWLVLRHGTRFPGSKFITPMIEKLPELQKIILDNYQRNKTSLFAEDAALLAGWKVTLTEDNIMKLVEEGENEMIDLAERYQSRFPTIMPEEYDNQTYRFKYTANQRTEESAKNFATGLFGRYTSQKVWYPDAKDKDPVLRFYKRCRRWLLQVHENPDAQIENEKFLQTEIYTKMLQDVSERIGYRVDHEIASLMYTMCGFETAWHPNIESPWCRMFSLNDLKVLEFAEDLKKYWVDGYGYKLNYEQACPALRNMFDFVTSDDGPLVSAYFTHSGTILKLLASLRVAQDDQHLMHDMFPLYGDDRAWKTGIIDAFASNIAFVLYNCSPVGPSLLFMHQERPLYLPGCPLHVPCPLSTMRALYPDHEVECQFDAMCSIEEESTQFEKDAES